MLENNNRVTIFSNGLADFVRFYSIPKDKTTLISIPAKTNHISDILSSLNVFGDVRLESPPSFSPSNCDVNNLSIDTENVWEDLAVKLSGSDVDVVMNVKLNGSDVRLHGTLVGLNSEEFGEKTIKKFLVLNTDSGLQRIVFSEIKSIYFNDESVRIEIDKSMSRNRQQLKPNSTFVDLSLAGTKENSIAVLQYVVPNAAWKISYRIDDNGNEIQFKGLAIVDNNTEEDWTDAVVSVVTGEPMTFSSDLSTSKTPKRNHVNVVNETTAGGIEVQNGLMATLSGMDMNESMLGGVRSCSLSATKGIARSINRAESAIVAETEIKEVGDYSIFTSKNPITIAANRSALIPVFDSVLNNAKTVLHYKSDKKQQRPIRCLQFKNETSHSLGRGVLTFYKDGTFSGTAILPATKQNEEQLVPYATETGVKITSHYEQEDEPKICRIMVKNGICFSEKIHSRKSEYSITNCKNESFEMRFDDAKTWGNSKVVGTLDAITLAKPVEVLNNGFRYSFVVDKKSTVVLKVEETSVQSQQMTIDLNNFEYFKLFIENSVPLEELSDIINIVGEINTIEQEMELSIEKVKKLSDKQIRLRENLKVISSTEQTVSWQNDLAKCENQITQIEDVEQPSQQAKLEKLKNDFDELLQTFVFEGKLSGQEETSCCGSGCCR